MVPLIKRFAFLGALLTSCTAPREDGDFDGAHARELVAAGAPLIDVRTPEEFADRHIDEAVNIPLQTIETRLEDVAELVGQDKTKPVVVHCRSGRRSASAREILRKHGFERVTNMGGIDVWDQ